jgi:transketolase
MKEYINNADTACADMDDLGRFAADIRIQTIRMFAHSGYGHIGGHVRLPTFWLCSMEASWRSKTWLHGPNPPGRKGPTRTVQKETQRPSLYAALSIEQVFPPWRAENPSTGRNEAAKPLRQVETPGTSMTTGSLGQGVSAAMGIAMGVG